MTNRRPQQPTEKALRQLPGASLGSAGSRDACELLLAELHSRRVRLQKLLQLVRMEAERLPARRAPLRPRARCGNARIRRFA